MALANTGIWADAAESRRLWRKIQSLQNPPGDALQDLLMAGELLGESELEKLATMAVINGVVVHTDRRISNDVIQSLPEQSLEIDELLEWLGQYLENHPADQEKGVKALTQAFSHLFGEATWLMDSYGLDGRPGFAQPAGLKLLLNDCVRVGSHPGEVGDRLRNLLLPSMELFAVTDAYWAQAVLSVLMAKDEARYSRAFIRFIFSQYQSSPLEGSVICEQMNPMLGGSEQVEGAEPFVRNAFEVGQRLVNEDRGLVEKMIRGSSDGSLEGSRSLFEWFIPNWDKHPAPDDVMEGMRRWIGQPCGAYLNDTTDTAGLMVLHRAWDYVFWAGLVDEGRF